jgi:hypothetical protein
MMTTDNSRQRLIDAVLEQIKADVQNGDLTTVEELIRELPTDTLINFLPEN